MAITINGSSGITMPDEGIEAKDLGNGAIIQVVQSVKTDHHDGTSGGGTFEDIGGTDQAGSGSVWCCKITPTTNSNKILVQVTVNAGTANWGMYYKLFRDSTALGVGDDLGGSRSEATFAGAYPNHADGVGTGSYTYLDSPSSTSELTYKIQGANRATSIDWKINKANGSGDYNYIWSVSSTITLMEVVA